MKNGSETFEEKKKTITDNNKWSFFPRCLFLEGNIQNEIQSEIHELKAADKRLCLILRLRKLVLLKVNDWKKPANNGNVAVKVLSRYWNAE